jgi:hypothetical protein
MVKTEKRIGNKETLLRIYELWEELSLRYEKLSLVSEATNDIDLTHDKALSKTDSIQGETPKLEKDGPQGKIARLDVSNSKGL